MVGELERVSRGLIEVFSRNLPWGMVEDQEKTQDSRRADRARPEYVVTATSNCSANVDLDD
jgi:hypothetical protein